MTKRSYHPAFSRSFGFYSEEEQALLTQATVAIAGVGGDGFQLAYKLAMNGVGTLKVADPEVFEVENANRVFAATKQYIGQNKAQVFKQMVSQLPAPPKVVIFEDGVTAENVDDFLSDVDLLIDESELTYLHIGTMLARKAREKSIPQLLVMNVGFAGVATSFKPTGGKTFEAVMGIPYDATLEEIATMTVDFGHILPYLPSYGDEATLREVLAGAPLPSISQGVDAAAAIGSTEAFLHLTASAHNHRKKPTWAPKFRYMDAYTNKSGIIHMPRISYAVRGATMILRSRLGLNPTATYTKSERDKRRKYHSK